MTPVIWIFERGERRATLEVIYLPPSQYEIHFLDAEGVDHVEHFGSATDAGKRQLELQATLDTQGWTRTGGWKL